MDFETYFKKLQENRNSRYNVFDEDENKHKTNVYQFLSGLEECFYPIDRLVHDFGFSENVIKSINLCFEKYFDDSLKGYGIVFKDIKKIRAASVLIILYTESEKANVVISRNYLKEYFSVLNRIKEENDFEKVESFINEIEEKRKERREKRKKEKS